MKKFNLIIFAIVGLITTGSAQGVPASSKVSASFNSTQISQMSADELAWNNFLADNMCIISQMPEEKTSSLTEINLGNQSNSTTATFNPFLAGIQPIQHENQYFRIAGTNKSLFVYSKDRLDIMYQRQNKNKE